MDATPQKPVITSVRSLDPHWYPENLPAKKYTCGHLRCGRDVASEKGWEYRDMTRGEVVAWIYLCPYCERPTYFVNQEQIPGPVLGSEVKNLPPDVHSLYEEVRKCISICAYSSAIMSGRKILMHVAVSEGADTNLKYEEYVNYLDQQNLIPKKAKSWVDKIRRFGNRANHEILIMSKSDAEEMLQFLEILLKVVYEYSAASSTQQPVQKTS